jgi:hypothetical protein
LVSGTYSYLATVANGGKVTSSSGYDIAFFSDSGLTTALKFERVVWVASTGVVEFHVKIPTLSHTTDTVIYIAYGDSGISTDQQDAVNVWGTNTLRVFHLNDNAANTTVTESKGTNGVSNGGNTSTRTSSSGKIANCFTYNGSNQYDDMGSTSPFTGSGDFTVGLWIKKTNSGTNLAAFQFGQNAVDGDQFAIEVNSSDKVQASVTNAYTALSSTSVADNAWHYIVVVATSSSHQIFIDGSADGSPVSQSYNIISGNHNTIGASFSGGSLGRYWLGSIDEVRISNVARSADWILTSYNNQNSPSTFYTLGSEQSTSVFLPRQQYFMRQAVNRASTY